MSRKVFLTFLGTGNYKECIYTFNEQKSKVVEYIQRALIDLVAPDYDEYIAFCTEKAYEKHFEKLNEECKKQFRNVEIPDGLSEKEIWEMFQIIFENLQDGDEVILDITHSFRSIPMLGITLLQYAKFIKNINVKGVYYGAFENLGAAYQIEEKYPNPEDRLAPILDLTPFSILQDWSQFGSQFINTGNINGLSKIAETSTGQILKDTKGKNQDAQLLKKINTTLTEIGDDFATNRGKKFLNGEVIEKFKRQTYDLENQILPAFNPILEKLNNEFQLFEEDNDDNLLHSVKWCIDKDLIQQGITQLQEGVITILCRKLEYDYKNIDIRGIISSYLSFGIKKDESEWKKPLDTPKAKDIISDLRESIKDLEKIAQAYNSLTDKRNDINHGGFNNHSTYDSKSFQRNLLENYNLLKNLLSD